jgi:hypothetical protein
LEGVSSYRSNPFKKYKKNPYILVENALIRLAGPDNHHRFIKQCHFVETDYTAEAIRETIQEVADLLGLGCHIVVSEVQGSAAYRLPTSDLDKADTFFSRMVEADAN